MTKISYFIFRNLNYIKIHIVTKFEEQSGKNNLYLQKTKWKFISTLIQYVNARNQNPYQYV